MSIINTYMPRTTHTTSIQKSKKVKVDSLSVAKDVAKFLAKGNKITNLDKRSNEQVNKDIEHSHIRWTTKFNNDGMPLSKSGNHVTFATAPKPCKKLPAAYGAAIASFEINKRR